MSPHTSAGRGGLKMKKFLRRGKELIRILWLCVTSKSVQFVTQEEPPKFKKDGFLIGNEWFELAHCEELGKCIYTTGVLLRLPAPDGRLVKCFDSGATSFNFSMDEFRFTEEQFNRCVELGLLKYEC